MRDLRWSILKLLPTSTLCNAIFVNSRWLETGGQILSTRVDAVRVEHYAAQMVKRQLVYNVDHSLCNVKWSGVPKRRGGLRLLSYSEQRLTSKGYKTCEVTFTQDGDVKNVIRRFDNGKRNRLERDDFFYVEPCHTGESWRKQYKVSL